MTRISTLAWAAASIGLLILSASTAAAKDKTACINVDSRQGWQRVALPDATTFLDFDVSGGWSVDAAHYEKVGPDGYTGADAEALSPYNQLKYAPNLPFGALLTRDDDDHLMSFRRFADVVAMTHAFGSPFDSKWREFRINDSDKALGDNGGSLRVCYTYGEAW